MFILFSINTIEVLRLLRLITIKHVKCKNEFIVCTILNGKKQSFSSE